MKNKTELTSSMQETLTNLLKGNEYRHTSNTRNALIKRGLMTEQGMITSEGRELAITFLPLEKQCEQLGLPIYEVVGPYNSEPEYFLWQHFKGLGFYIAYCEGGAFLTLIKAAALSILAEINTFGSRDDACTRFLEAQFTIHKKKSTDILDVIEHATLMDVEANFEEIYRHLIAQEAYPGLENAFISSLFSAIGSKCLRNIAEFLFEDPYCYRNGWPDLTLVKDGRIWLFEVKTTDRFHLSQIKTIPKIQKIIPAQFAVIHLKQGSEIRDGAIF
jgi:hypothetical protein